MLIVIVRHSFLLQLSLPTVQKKVIIIRILLHLLWLLSKHPNQENNQFKREACFSPVNVSLFHIQFTCAWTIVKVKIPRRGDLSRTSRLKQGNHFFLKNNSIQNISHSGKHLLHIPYTSSHCLSSPLCFLLL